MARAHNQRLFWLALGLTAAFCGMGAKLVHIQVVQHDRLKSLAEKNTRLEYLVEPRRGDVLDAKGNLLATTTYSRLVTICADPELASTNYLRIAGTLAPILLEDEVKLARKLRPRFAVSESGQVLTNKPVRWVMLKQRVPVEMWDQACSAMTNLSVEPTRKLSKSERTYFRAVREKCLFKRVEPLRLYPNGRLASHVLGFTAAEERKIRDAAVTELVGWEGMEQFMDEKLAGVRGWRVTGIGHTEGQRREQVWLRQQNVDATDGCNVVLTIDSVIQQAVESALAEAVEIHKPISASCMVVRPSTGAVLAMATLPNFDPNAPSTFSRNRIVSDIYEPGSTFKIVVVSAALNEQVVNLTDVIYCEDGTFFYGGKTLRDHGRYKDLTVEGIITKSSNIGAGKIGLKLGEARLYDYMRRFGFSEKTGIPLVGEVPGLLQPTEKWSKISIVQLPMGHGIAVTPVQMTMAMAAIANKGVLMRPMLVDRLEDRDGSVITQYEPQKVRRVISEAAARQTVQALKTVPAKGGTAPKAALDHYTVAGKTGTAQKAENGKYVRRYYSSFIGFFPADNPELCISVIIDEPKGSYYGGETAAPVFKHVAEKAARYLGIKPDKDPPEDSAENLTAGAAD